MFGIRFLLKMVLSPIIIWWGMPSMTAITSAVSPIGLTYNALTGKFDGKSGNQQVATLTPEQKALMDKYLGALGGGVQQNVNTLQGYANNGYNPYDAVAGDQLVGQMKDTIARREQGQLDAIKGGALNRFSLASAKAMGDVQRNANEQLTDLDYKNLMTKTGYGQQAYQNQNDAISKLFSMSGSMVGQGAFQNQQTYQPGLLDRFAQIGQIAGGLGSFFKSV